MKRREFITLLAGAGCLSAPHTDRTRKSPYGQNPQILVTDGIGGSPYGPSTLAGTDGSRQPVEAELTTARNLGSRLARIAGCLKDLRASRVSAP